ncbi:MAG TPA: ATP-binding cassette domain-containing protein [Bacteroidetes bacterium]|nr:ATP-binding cassette domain-containing protein [Bacteroidota bacterium]
MAKDFKNKIKRLELENFTCFGKVAMDFSPGINVIIGENGTGKTHLLKVLYALSATTQPDILFIEKIFKVFDKAALIKENFDSSHISFFMNGEHSTVQMKREPVNYTDVFSEPSFVYINSNKLFLPTLEMLSWFKGFISSYENRESYVDETYYRLAKAIDPLSLKGDSLKKQLPLLKELEIAINATVVRKGDDFFISFKGSKKLQPAPLVASGINKLAQLIWLIMNGSLTKDTILFWDEPEANLNPKYILVVAKFLQTLANAGCQIFVATHDYLLPYDLSLSAEYKKVSETPVPDMKFFSLFKGKSGTEVEEGATMPDLGHDAVHEGLTLHQDREDRLFQKSLNINP